LIKLGGGLDAPKTAANANKPADKAVNVNERGKTAEVKEKEQLESLLEDLRKAIAVGQTLEPFKDQLLLDITSEGLRVQIVDKQNRTMFDSGSSALKDYTTQILVELAPYLNRAPNRISLSGHTDAKPYPGTTKFYSNWELSADRANAARRALISGGLDDNKIVRVVGLASSVLFDKDEPLSPVNRRISIIVMTRRAEDAALSTDAPASGTTAPGEPASTAALPAADAAATTTLSAAPAAPPAGPDADHSNAGDSGAGLPGAGQPAAGGPAAGAKPLAPQT
jgi:chemotaxis protein MotB